MKPKNQNLPLLAAMTLAGSAFTAPSALSADFTWDTVADDGATITVGSGVWNTAAPNIVWNDGTTPNVAWTQVSATAGSNTATFAGADGTVDQYVVTLGEAVAAQSITFNNSGYKVTGGTLALMDGTNNGPITVASGKTATINSILRYNHNKATPVALDGVLNLGGGTTPSFNPQLNLSGSGSVNFTGGTFTSNIGNVNVPTANLTGGTYNYTPGNGAGATIGNNAGQDVSYTVSGTGTLTCNNNAGSGTGTSLSYLGVGNATAAFQATLTVQTGGTVIIGSGKYGELQIARNADSNGKLDVQGGTVTIASGTTSNKIYLFKSGANASRTAAITQSGGTMTANGIQFGSNAGTYDVASAAALRLSGGSLYVGTQGITRGTGAGALPVAIQLQGGTLGAAENWSSSLDMVLGTTGGGVAIQAANSGGAARNITLSGILSDDGAVNGTLTKTGSGSLTLSGANDNTFSGATLVSAGTLSLGKESAVSNSSSVTIADGAALALNTSSSTVPNLTFSDTGTLSFDVASGYSLTGSAVDGVTNSGAAESVTINITGSAPATGTYTLISYSGSIQGSGFSAYKLGTTPAGKSYSLFDAAGAVQLVVTGPSFWTGAQSSEWSTNVISGAKNWTVSASPADYVNGAIVVFDESAANKTVDISVADVTPASVEFNSASTYTLQGSNSIVGPSPVMITAGTLKLGAANVLPDGSGSGNVTIDGTLDLNGFSETINGLSGAASGVVDNLAGGAVTLTVGNGGGSGTIFGTIQNTAGSLGIVKVGSGQLFLRGNSSFSGGVLVTNGTLNGGTSPNSMGTGGVTLGGSGSTGATFIGGQNFSTVDVTANAPDSGINVVGANGAGSGMVVRAITLNNSDLTLQTWAAGTTAATTVNGGVTGTGNLILDNLSTTTGKVALNTNTVNHTGSITNQGVGTTGNQINADIGANVTGITQNSPTCPLILNGANTYPGNLTINAGLVRLSNAPDPLNANTGNDGSAVTIDPGATLDLTYTGTDIVNKLFIGTSQLDAGEYGSGDLTQITGGGTLTVLSGPGGGFSSWITGAFANGTIPSGQQGPDDDFDKDGISNLVEYAVADQDPTVGNSTISTFIAGTLSFNKRAGTSGLTYAIQDSVDLGITDAWAEVTAVPPVYVNDATTISYTLTPGTPAKNFIRLQVLAN